MAEEILHTGRILIVEDEVEQIRLLRRVLKENGFKNIETTTDSLKAVELFSTFKPDLMLLDLAMPELDGFGVLAQIRPLIPDGEYFPILMMTANPSIDVKRKALA